MNTDFDVWVYSAADINQSFQRIRKVENFQAFLFPSISSDKLFWRKNDA